MNLAQQWPLLGKGKTFLSLYLFFYLFLQTVPLIFEWTSQAMPDNQSFNSPDKEMCDLVVTATTSQNAHLGCSDNI